MKDMDAILKFLKGFPLLIIGLLTILIGANVFTSLPIAVNNIIVQWLLIVLGIIAFAVNIYLEIKERFNQNKEWSKNYGVVINSPQDGDRLETPIVLTGESKKRPNDNILYAFEFNPNTNQYYPKSKVVYQGNTNKWTTTVHIGGGDDKIRRIKIAAVGKNGKYFIDYYQKVARDTNKTYHIGVVQLPSDVKILTEVKIYLSK